MRIHLATAAILLVVPLSAARASCDHFSAPRHLASPASGITRVVVDSGAGKVKIHGVHGAADIRADGTACAANESDLQNVKLVLTREGSELRIKEVVPEHFGFHINWDGSDHVDFDVELPDSVALAADSGSGSVTITSVASLALDSGSGSVAVDGVAGPATVDSGSGSVKLANVKGDLKVDSGSGSVEIRGAGRNVAIDSGSGSVHIAGVGGSVHMPDQGSGSVRITDVTGSVTIDSGGSGSIHVTNVGGDFTVADKGSGSIDYDGVKGHVHIAQ